jgi:hypothetical protein
MGVVGFSLVVEEGDIASMLEHMRVAGVIEVSTRL